MGDYSLGVEPVASAVSLVYVLLAMCAALILARNTNRFFLVFVLLFWIIGQPALDAYYTISPTWLPFDFQPNRILFLILIPALVHLKLQNPHSGGGKIPYFQKYFPVFIGFVILSMILNFGALPPKQLVSIPLESIKFLLLFIFVKSIINQKIMVSINRAVLIVALLNAFIGFYQLVDPYFLRTADLRPAFGGVFRSFGIFPSEYTFGGTLTIAFFVALFTVSNKMTKFFMLLIISAALVTTFHRMDLLIFFVCMCFCLIKYFSGKVAILGTTAIAIAMTTMVLTYVIYSSSGGSSQFVEERLMENTITGRFHQFRVTLGAMPTYPLGLGSDANPVYQSLMIDAGISRGVYEDGQNSYFALPVHNGFLMIGIMHGIGAMLVFSAILVSMVLYFYRHADINNKSTLIPLIAVIAWILGNMSNGLVAFRSYNILLVAIYAGAYVDYRFRPWGRVGANERTSVTDKRALG